MTAPEKNNIVGDQWEVTIDPGPQQLAPFFAQVELPISYLASPITSGRTGRTPIKHLVDGVQVGFRLSVIEYNADQLKAWLSADGAGGQEVLAAGNSIPTHRVVLHDPLAADAAGDITLHAVAFTGFTHSSDGEGEKMFVVDGAVELDASFNTIRIGPES